ncbi:zinc transporter ZIP3-like [Ptychodera flava]|uniref:zinc transporter ZIP3-like n=1 Tax=Ptychodera flava TaxID=63121 RepID=UPI00396A6721
MELLVLQIIFMAAIFLGTLLCGLIPIKVIPRPGDKETPLKTRSGRIIAVCNCFSGGVFLGTCFLGVIPAAEEKLESILREKDIQTTYPLNDLIVMLGFIFILFLEQTVLTFQDSRCSDRRDKGDPELELGDVNSSHAMLIREDSSEEEEIVSNHSNRVDDNPLVEKVNGDAKQESHSHHHDHHHYHGHSDFGHSHHGHIDGTSTLRSVILLLALSSHSFLEGMAFGLQDDTTRTINLFIAIIIHECLASFAFSVSLIGASRSKRSTLMYVLLFCVMIPIGMVIGLSLQTSPSASAQLASAILQSFAAGTFIHVTFFEILSHEFETGSDRLLKVLFLTLGLGAIAGLEFVD